MNKKQYIPYGRQLIDDDDIQAVVDALKSGWLTTGPKVEEFESALSDYCGAKHAIVVSNGTAALHLAMLAAGIGKGDKVLTTPNTFLASANCAEFVGASVEFIDVEPRTYNIDHSKLALVSDDTVRAVVAVDFAGRPCEMPLIMEWAKKQGVTVIEDASHAIGSTFEHNGVTYRVGGHPWADMTTFSFHPVKAMTTGEGGAIVTNSDELAERCRIFRNHGMTKDVANYKGPLKGDGDWYYEMQELGYNYRITDMQCALGLSQLRKLDKFIDRRAEIVLRYNDAFARLDNVVCPMSANSVRTAWHLYVLQIDFEVLGKSRSEVMSELREQGVGTQVHYVPVHLQPYYVNKYGYAEGKCPVAENYYKHCLSLPLFPSMTDDEVEYVIRLVCDVLG